jgi:hypothetical protein
MAPIDSSAFFTVENLDPEPFTYKFQGRTVTLMPNLPKPIPFDQMLKICGDPRTGTDDRNALRRDAVTRLRQQYGIYDDAQAWENRPKLKVTDEDGNIVSTPLWDPEGEPVYESADPVDYDTMMAKVARHERDLAQLKSQMEAEVRAMKAKGLSEARADIAPEEPQLPLADSQVPAAAAPTAAQGRRTKARPAVEEPTQDPGAVKTDAPTRPAVS